MELLRCLVLCFTLTILPIALALDVEVLSIARLHSNPTIQWYTRMNNSIVTLTLIGPADRWFAIGIGGTTMYNTYTIVVLDDGTVTEHRLGQHNAGDMLPTVATDLEYEQRALNGIRTVKITRSRVGYSNLFYTFPDQRVYDVGIIAAWAMHPGLSFGITHGVDNRLSDYTAFLFSNETTLDPTTAPTRAPTAAPTRAPSNAPTLAPTFSPTDVPTKAPTVAFENRYDLYGRSVLGGDNLNNIELVIGIEADTSTAFINITGPTAQWFAIGFGSGTKMKDKYSIIVDWTRETGSSASFIDDDNILEYYLGDHAVDAEKHKLDKFVDVKIQFDTEIFRRNVLMERPIFNANDERYYNFSKCNRKYTVIWARGEYKATTSSAFESLGNGHTVGDRGSGTITVEGEGFDDCDHSPSIFDKMYYNLLFCAFVIGFMYFVSMDD